MPTQETTTFSVRMPQDLRDRLQKVADIDERSLNNLIVHILGDFARHRVTIRKVRLNRSDIDNILLLSTMRFAIEKTIINHLGRKDIHRLRQHQLKIALDGVALYLTNHFKLKA